MLHFFPVYFITFAINISITAYTKYSFLPLLTAITLSFCVMQLLHSRGWKVCFGRDSEAFHQSWWMHRGRVMNMGGEVVSIAFVLSFAGALFSTLASVESVMFFLGSVLWPYIYSLTVQYNLRTGISYVFMGIIASLLLPLLM